MRLRTRGMLMNEEENEDNKDVCEEYKRGDETGN